MDNPFLCFIIGLVLGVIVAASSSDNYATRAMQCVVNQQHASSTDPIAICSKILNVNHHSD